MSLSEVSLMLIDMFIAPLTLFVVAGCLLLRNHRIRATWYRTPAVVTANVERSVGGGNHDLFPVFTFVSAWGDQRTVQQRVNRPRFRVGDRVDVLHHPADPTQVRADHWMVWHGVPALLAVVGVAALAFSFLG
jgi:hypothetical protein